MNKAPDKEFELAEELSDTGMVEWQFMQSPEYMLGWGNDSD